MYPPINQRLANLLLAPSRCARRPRRAFTLVELIVVVAILAILAIIAVPNFLEAQTRAKVSQAKANLTAINTAMMSYTVDYNKVFPDANDSNSFPNMQGETFQKENPGVTPDVTFRDPSVQQYYMYGMFKPITTPIAYMTTMPLDPFSKMMPMGYDTREVDHRLAYCAMFSAGPDRVEGDWMRSLNPTGQAVTYDPTNGTISQGDIWRAMVLGDASLFHREYGPEN